MATSPYYSLIGYFPVSEAPEVTELLDALELEAEYEDVWKLAKAARGALGPVIQGFTNDHFEATWDPIAARADEVTTAFIPVDPAKPTPEELLVIQGLMTQMLAAFHPLKTPVIERAVADMGGAGNDWQKLRKVAVTDAAGAALLVSNDWYQYLASYYIAMSQGYIRLSSREYFFLGRVLDDLDDAPVRGVRVHCKDINLTSTERSFGFTTTNREGYFKTRFTVLDGVEIPPYTLRFTFFHELLGASGVVRDLDFDPGEQEPIVAKLVFDLLESDSSPIASTGIAIPADVQTYLTANSIVVSTLEDIRHLGGFKNLPTETIDKADPDLLKLDGLASLELLQHDVAKNNTLYTRGYESVTDIALTPQGVFVEENNDLFLDFGAGAIHYMAKAGHMHGVNQMAAQATPVPSHDALTPTATGGARNCDCPDCKSGVSPLAYLTDLLAFTKQHVQVNDAQITWGFLQSNFKQSFIGLRKSCSQMKERLCQNRIAAEVMRAYLEANPPTGGQLTAFNAAEKEYLMQAYELLLGKLGTSYTELRILRASSDEQVRQRLADRMGVLREDANGATLEQVLIDLSNAANIVEGQGATDPPNTASGEPVHPKGLELLFGLRDTTRDVFEVTPESKVEQWKKAKLRQEWKEADGLSTPYWQAAVAERAVIIDPDVVTIDDLRHPSDTTANGDPAAFNIWKKRRDWIDAEWAALDGKIIPTLDLPPDDFDHFYAPAKDHIKDGYLVVAHGAQMDVGATSLTYTPPVGSPIGYTVERAFHADGNTYFKVNPQPDEDRFGGTLTVGVVDHTNDRPVRNCTAMINRLCAGQATAYPGGSVQPNWPANATLLIDDLLPLISDAALGDVQALEDIEALHFDLPMAQRFVALYDQNKEAEQDYETEGGLSPDEWAEFKSILIQVLKNKLSEPTDEWREEEDNALLSPVHFRPAIHAPRVGHFPALKGGALIDPDNVTERDLPEVTVLHYQNAIGTNDAREVLEERRDDLMDDRDALISAHDVGYQELLDLAFDTPGLVWDEDPENNNYLTLLNDLADPVKKGWASAFMTQRLRLSETELQQVVSLGAKEDSGEVLTENELNGLYNTLLRAHKQLVRLAPTGSNSWIASENDPNVREWKLRKAALPKWRASQARRDAWLNALAEHSARPIIDADLIGPAELHMPEDGDPAYMIFSGRWKDMHGNAEYPDSGTGGWLNEIGAFPLTNTTQFNTLTKQYLGFVEDSLLDIREQLADGTDIRPRIAQLTLTPIEFNRLMACYDLLEASSTLTVEEKSIVQHILANVQKRRHFYTYRLEETESGITLSQDHFKLREQTIVSFPPQPDTPLTEWLAEERDLILWRRTLRGRVEQEKSVLNDWQEVLFEVDEAMMVHLRDAMIKAVSPVGQNLVVSARNLGDQLLIDLENNCCYKTNRVAAAMETLQQLLWKTRTGDILAHYPNVRYTGGDFNEAWTWIGNYANWRAAMFVFLYPENVLHPSLRKDVTPAFREVVEATRNNRRFGPGDACVVAHRYADYIRDITELEVKCAQQATAFVGDDHCGASLNVQRKLSFVFAQAKGSKRPYFTMVDTNDLEQVQQTAFWTLIPGIEEEPTLRGCDLYVNWDERINHIYLFYTLKGTENKSKFFALRYGLESMQWETEPIEFEVSQDELTRHPHSNVLGLVTEDFDTAIRSLCVLKNSEPWQSPTLAISLMHKAGYPHTFSRYLTGDGKSLIAGDEWHLWMTSFENPRGSLIGDVLDFWYYYPPEVTEWNWTNVLQYFLLRYWDNIEQVWVTHIVRRKAGDTPLSSYQRVAVAPTWPSSPGLTSILIDSPGKRFYAFAKQYGIGHEWSRVVWEFDNTSVFDHPTLDITEYPMLSDATELTGLLDNAGIAPHVINKDVPLADSPTLVVYQRRNDSQMFICRAGHDENLEQFVWGPERYRLSTRLFSQPSIGAAPLGDAQDVNASLSEESWFLNVADNPRLLVPVMEAWYFVPLQIGLQLQVNGYYQEALDWFRSLYDFRRPLAVRKISYLLTQEETINTDVQRLADWYADPLNPHAIAATRRHTYTRYTIISIVNCLLAYADAEFTVDNSETVPRARELYEDALALMRLLVAQSGCADDAVHEALDAQEMAPAWRRVWEEVLARLEPLSAWEDYGDLLAQITAVLEGSDPISEQLAEVNDLIDAALAAYEHPTIGSVLEDHVEVVAAATASALGSLQADLAVQQLIQDSGIAFERSMTAVTGLSRSGLEAETIEWLVDDREMSGFGHGHAQEYISPAREHDINAYTEQHPAQGFNLNNPFPNVWLSGVSFSFCVVPNPIAGALVMKAEVELWKIHNCMNIAGMVRELDPFSAPTDSTTGIPVIGAGGGSIAIPGARSIPPSAYRYRVLLDRARQLVGMAQQVEAAFLSTLEKLDAERYSQLRAEQDIATSKATIKLQDLKVNEANSGVRLAEMQKERAALQVSELQKMIDAGLLGAERNLQELYLSLAIARSVQAAAMAVYQSIHTQASGNGIIGKLTALTALLPRAISAGAELSAIGIDYNIQIASLRASLERRQQEWGYQQTMAQKDVEIGDQQIKLANDRVRIVGQEREIAMLQNEHARATLDFLKNKFTSAELYEWMSQVLEDAYAWFLQEATAMALLAERQLAFERQLDLPPFIRTDYWIVDGGSMGGVDMTGQGVVDRRGLTGSTRLLKDLTELDQYAFNTNSPKQQLTKTIALSELAPEELVALRSTGIARFYTTQELFDRDYPGHYLRLIKRVSVTVIALTPPTKGIRATLANGGTSQVVVGGTIFQERVIKRFPEVVAFSSGVGDHGVFQLQPDGEFLHPFEGSGVETGWEFRMEKAANPFDFGSIADVLFTIEYESLNSFLYRNTVAQRLNQEPATSAVAISVKNNLPDQWFDLHNPPAPTTNYQVSFQINQRDLAPNLSEPYGITRAVAYAVMNNGQVFPYLIGLNRDAPADTLVAFSDSGIAILSVPTDVGAGPIGTWSLAFGPDGATQPEDPFANKRVDDIFIMLTYDGESTPYLLV